MIRQALFPSTATLAAALLGLLGAPGLAPPAAADWLVTRDGARVETAGPWEVKARLVVFHTPRGDLASMRLDEVDLDASRQATEEAARPREEPRAEPAPKPRAVMVITDADVEHVRAEERQEVEAESAIEEGELEVVDFEELDEPDFDGLVFAGNVRNSSDKMILTPRVTMSLYDADGELVARVEAPARAGFLRPSQSAPFRVEFPAVFIYERTAFETAGDPLAMRPPDAGGEEDEAGASADG